MLIAVVYAITIATTAQAAQNPAETPQKLFESGKIQEAIDSIKARADAPQDQI